MADRDIAVILNVSLESTLSFVLAIVLAYFQYQFFKLPRETVKTKRRGYISTLYTRLAIIILLFGYPLQLIEDWIEDALILIILKELLYVP